jgi:hypothetical protein
VEVDIVLESSDEKTQIFSSARCTLVMGFLSRSSGVR